MTKKEKILIIECYINIIIYNYEGICSLSCQSLYVVYITCAKRRCTCRFFMPLFRGDDFTR